MELKLDRFSLENLRPLRVYSYPSSMHFILADADINDAHPRIREVFDKLFEKLREANMSDNKVVLECMVGIYGKFDEQYTISFGWYDGRLRIGVAPYNKDGAQPHPFPQLEESTSK